MSDKIISKWVTNEYRQNWDIVFGKKPIDKDSMKLPACNSCTEVDNCRKFLEHDPDFSAYNC